MEARTKEIGKQEWHMGKVLRPTPMDVFDTKDFGSKISLSDYDWTWNYHWHIIVRIVDEQKSKNYGSPVKSGEQTMCQ